MTVTAVDDAVVEGPQVSTLTHTASSVDTNYNGLVIPALTVNVTDNDTAGVTLVASGGSTDVTEGGLTDTYTVVLDTIPCGRCDGDGDARRADRSGRRSGHGDAR